MDRDVHAWVVSHRAEAVDDLFVALSVVGYAGAIWIGAGIVLAVAWRRPPVALATAAAVWTSDLLALGGKALWDRPRPFDEVPEPEPLILGVAGASFPSGHAATSAAGALLLSRHLPAAAPVFAALALAVGFSRLYVGVHYLTDVLAGFALGVAVATALLTLAAIRRRSGRARRRG